MKAQIVSFHCVLKNKLGQVISSSFNRDVINQIEGKHGELRGLIAGLQDLKPGEKRQVFVSADQAYGLYDPELVVEVPRSELNRGRPLSSGADTKELMRESDRRVFRVVDFHGDSVVLDGNHPLAGQDLVFDIEVVSARDAVEGDFDEEEPVARHYVH